MINNMDRLLSTILLGNNLVNVAFTALVTALAVNWLGEGPLALTAATVIGTTVLLILGEIIPKSVAVKKSEKMTFLYARPLKMVELSLYPVILFLQWLSRATQTIFGNEANDEDPAVTEGELRMLINIGESEGSVDSTEAARLQRVFSFGDRQIQEIVTPRPEIVWIEKGCTLGEFLAVHAKHSHTRFPVYEGSTENILGVISNKDAIVGMSKDDLRPNDDVSGYLRPAFFAPETNTISSIFDEMQKAGHNMVLTVDEFGGIGGLATLKQLLGVIVGDIGDDGSAPEEELIEIDDHTYDVNAGMAIAEINDEIGIEIPEGDYQTVAGFILSELGYIPEIGEVVEHGRLRFVIQKMSGVKIELVQLTTRGEIGVND
jgi:putative hemolysin